MRLVEPSSATALLAARKTLAQGFCVHSSLVKRACDCSVPLQCLNVGYTCKNPAETHQQ